MNEEKLVNMVNTMDFITKHETTPRMWWDLQITGLTIF